MANNNFYIPAGIVPIDNSSGATANSFYIAAGLIPTDTSGESSSPLPSLYSISARSGSCTAKSGLGSIDNIGVNDYKKYEM